MSDIEKDDHIILNKGISGLVQATRKYHKKAVKILKNLRFVGGNDEPWFYIKKSAKGVVYIAQYVDNNLMGENVATVDNATSALQNNRLLLKFMERLQDCCPMT